MELGARSANALRSADDPTRGRGARLRDDAEPFTPEGRVIDQGSSQRGTPSTGRLVEETELVGQSSVLPEITGRIWNTSVGQYLLDAEDPFLGRFAL